MGTKHWGWLMVQVCIGLFLLVGCGEARKSASEKGGQHDAEAQAAVKTNFDSYSAAVAAIDKHRAHLEELIEHKKLAVLHEAAKPIQQIAKTLNTLARKTGSGVPRESLKGVNLTSKALADTWEKIDEAGDAGNLEAAKKVYEEIVGLINTLKKFAHTAK